MGAFLNPERKIVSLNVAAYDAAKHSALPLMADARIGLEELTKALGAQALQKRCREAEGDLVCQG